MEQFGIDLDKVLNDFEEQENRNEVEKWIDSRKKEDMEISVVCSRNTSDLHESGSRLCVKPLPRGDISSGLNKMADDASSISLHRSDLTKDVDELSAGLSSNEITNEAIIDETDSNFRRYDIWIENSKPIIVKHIRTTSFFVKENFVDIYLAEEQILMKALVDKNSLAQNDLHLNESPMSCMEDGFCRYECTKYETSDCLNVKSFDVKKSLTENLNAKSIICVGIDESAESYHFKNTNILHISNEKPCLDETLVDNLSNNFEEDIRPVNVKILFGNALSQEEDVSAIGFGPDISYHSHQEDRDINNFSGAHFLETGCIKPCIKVDVAFEGVCKNDENENEVNLGNMKQEAGIFFEKQIKNGDVDLDACGDLQQIFLENGNVLPDNLRIINDKNLSGDHLGNHKEPEIEVYEPLVSDNDSNMERSEIIFNESRLQNKIVNEATVETVEDSHLDEENKKQKNSRQNPPGSLQFSQPQFFHAPSRCSNIDLPITELGKVSPPWLPDASTNKCLQCETLFSFLRRRHHCRACGLIFCNECCNVRYPLDYMNKKDGRVCCKCFVDFNRASSYLNMLTSLSIPTSSQPSPNNSSDYCLSNPHSTPSTANDHLLPVMVPSGVLRKRGSLKPPSENKQVMFSDGIRPGGDLTYLDEKPGRVKKKNQCKSSNSSISLKKQVASNTKLEASTSSKFDLASNQLYAEEVLPPLAIYSAKDFGYVLDWNGNSEMAFQNATNADINIPAIFSLNANLIVFVKVIKKLCCIKREMWCFSTRGMSTVGQEELVILLEFNKSETTIPLDIFQAISSVYNSAKAGTPVKNLGSIILPLNSNKDVYGFLFINHTIQCIKNVLLPQAPYLFGIFIKQIELTWARAFPLRLFFRLGAEFRYYPCPLFGVRDRTPVYGDVGHTIMNLLADFRNFQYSLSSIDDMTIHIEEKHTTIHIPKHKHHQMLKALSNSDDHVFALAGTFSSTADSHLVCLQNSEGSYQTQALNIQGKLRNGASFVVFNGALKMSSGYNAKMSIIEDGLMIQITPEDMSALKQALAATDDFTIDCGFSSMASTSSSPGSEGVFDGKVSLTWFSEQTGKNSDIKSPIDELNLSWLDHKLIHSSSIYSTSPDGFTLIWTGIFFINLSSASQTLKLEVEKFSAVLASSCCKCLTPYISALLPTLLSKLSIRIRVNSDQIGYEAGINGSQLSSECLGILDNTIIPLLHSSSLATQPFDTSFELLFIVAKPINTDN